MSRKRLVSRTQTLTFAEVTAFNTITKVPRTITAYYPWHYQNRIYKYRNLVTEFLRDSHQILPEEDVAYISGERDIKCQCTLTEKEFLLTSKITPLEQ